jgi:1-deoxyxylulose-5-phosphate synthase
MSNLNRRAFIRGALAGAGVLALPWGDNYSSSLLALPVERIGAADRVALGNSGIVTSRLAIGSGTHGVNKSSNQTKLGLDKFVGLIRHGYERGVTFWETADQYGSHPHYREALKYVPRDKVVILTKSTTRDAAGMKADIERFRKELNTDMIDVLLLHVLTDPKWTDKMQATMDVISEAREKGHIRSFGVSCHDLGALRAAVASDWVEVILARINHVGASMDGEPAVVVPVLKEAHGKGKGIIGMKLAGAGRIRDQLSESLNYVLGLGCVDAFTMGFESTAELDDLIGKVSAVGA